MWYTFQEWSGLFLGEFLFLSRPLYDFFVLWTDSLTVHTSYDAVVPGSVHPVGEWKIAFFLIMINNASLSPQKKTV
jgi:hypothetical protein